MIVTHVGVHIVPDAGNWLGVPDPGNWLGSDSLGSDIGAPRLEPQLGLKPGEEENTNDWEMSMCLLQHNNNTL